MELEFLESSNEIINIDNVIPISDDTGKNQSNYFAFQVRTKTKETMDITYNLYVEKLEPSPEYISLKDKEVKIYLTDYEDNALLIPTKVSDLDNYLIYEKTNKHNETNEETVDKYKLRIWIDNEVTGEGWSEDTKIEYRFKIGVSTEVRESAKLDTSGANEPVLSSDMVPVYYDSANDAWRKADSENINERYKWYNYDEKMWANAVTYDHTKVLDLSSSSSDGKIEGATYTSSGIKFDGNDYINAGNANYDFRNSITVVARFKTSSLASNGSALIDNLENGGFEFFVSKNGPICFQVKTSTSSTASGQRVCSKTIPDLNTWNIAVASYDGQIIKLYLNGKLEGIFEIIDTISLSTQPIFIGAQPNGSGVHTGYFNGTISDALVINDVLTEEEIETYYSDKINYQENENTLFYYNMRGYEGRTNGTKIPMEMINTMLVWIPRYTYTIWNYNLDGTVTSNPQEIQIEFEEGTNSNGEISCEDNVQGTSDGTASGTEPTSSEICKLKSSGAECTNDACNEKTYTHPAFTFGEEELTGFWVGKFEVSSDVDCTAVDYESPNNGCNVSTSKILIKPNNKSWRGIQIARQANNMLAMNDSNNIYGFANSDDTHMIKNMEWGAVAYLSHSKYGTCTNGECKEVALNSNSNYITGCGPQEEGSVSSGEICNNYKTELGESASTTGNIYGVYDMSGGSWEQIMSAIISSDGKNMMVGNNNVTTGTYKYANSDFSGIIYNSGSYASYTGNYTLPNIKYYDKYSFGTSNSQINRSKLGDAIKEMHNETGIGWNNDSIHLGYDYSPWFFRGGWNNNNLDAGIFASSNYLGYATDFGSTRLVISQN